MHDEELNEIFDSLQCLSANISLIGDEILDVINKVREFIEKVELERDIRELERSIEQLEGHRDEGSNGDTRGR